MEPSIEMELDMVDEATSPVPNPVFPPASQLRRAFFRDMDASSKVNPNRSRKSIGTQAALAAFAADSVGTVRTIIVGDTREESPSSADLGASRNGEYHARLSINPREDFGAEESAGYYDDDDGAEGLDRSEVYVPRTDGNRPVWAQAAAKAHQRSARDQVRATSAVMTNAISGSLCGVALRRTSSAALANLGAGVVVTQMLCWMGYARVEWAALLQDTFSLVFQGTSPPTSPAQAQNRLRQWLTGLVATLTSTVPRRLSFWLGVAGGFLLL